MTDNRSMDERFDDELSTAIPLFVAAAFGSSAAEDRVAASGTRGSPPDDPRPRPSYGTACAVMAAGVAAVATMDSQELELSMLSLSPLIAAQLGALRCGIGPGWLAGVSVVATVAWFLPPDGSFLVDDWSRLLGWVVWSALINTVWPGGGWDRGCSIISRLYSRRAGGSRPRRHRWWSSSLYRFSPSSWRPLRIRRFVQ